MLLEAEISRLMNFTRRAEKATPQRWGHVKIEWDKKYPDPEVAYIAFMNSLIPQDLTEVKDFVFLSTLEPVYRSLNGFFFKIHPVSLNPDGSNTYLIERKATQEDALPLDFLEIKRNPINPRDPTHTDLSLRRLGTKRGVTEFTCLRGKSARPHIEAFLSSMTPLVDPARV